jgi:CHAT domain-containing protein
VRRVLVSPDGVLASVPFVLLLGTREVAYTPSGAVHLQLSSEKPTPAEGILAVGDPKSPEGLLPQSRAEATSIGDVVLLGDEATEEALRRTLATRPRWRAVHLACHGRPDEDRPTLSALELTPAGDDDGHLTALEVFRLPVPADLVVLSACETARGKVVRGEGVLGLTRAFMFAGAPRVIVSLWKVPDVATRELMTRFYEGLKAKKGPAAALRDAQESVRRHERWRHPYHWAAWTLWGFPR